MANLESLDYTSISNMSVDEALEHLRQIRLSRRIPLKKTKTTRKTTKKKQTKVSSSSMTAEEIEELLKILGDS